ncbi:DUF5711 family protein [Konateibacter massiliensis]|uniref:DUF5711 family protein n=1 Tax=Konateibacter massiliensis TaxID=2002841 RepID=UPI000C14FFDF|nr:DUF5711 family protein [Konateibacter massiliensis]
MPNIREYLKNKKDNDDRSFMKKLFIHRVAVFYRIIIILVVLIAIGVGSYLYFQNKVYTNYNVISTVERTDTTTTTYYEYAGGILKCSNDGASYTDYTDKVLWNQTFEMINPMVDICNEYVAVADREGNKIYVFNTKGLQAEISINQPIEKLQVASQGVVYTVLDDGNNSLIQVFDKEGNELVTSKQPMTKSGYPMDIAVSDDGEKLAVSYLYADSGIMKTNIAFYNFGSVGQNEIDHLVSAYTYDSSVFPSIQYANETTAVAFGDRKVGIYKGKQRPEMIKEIEVEEEIESVFCSKTYFGLVFENSDTSEKYRLELYDLEGNKVKTLNFSQDYTNIVISEKEVIIVSEMEFSVYKMSGLKKFQYTAQKALLNVIPDASFNKYIVIDAGSTQVINLKLN